MLQKVDLKPLRDDAALFSLAQSAHFQRIDSPTAQLHREHYLSHKAEATLLPEAKRLRPQVPGGRFNNPKKKKKKRYNTCLFQLTSAKLFCQLR